MLLFGIFLIVEAGFAYEWDTSILNIQPWNVTDCKWNQNLSEQCGQDIQNSDMTAFDTCNSRDNCTIKVAVILPGKDEQGYLVNIEEAKNILNQLKNESLPFNFTSQFYDDKCKQEYATVHLIPASNDHAHVIFGPICDYCLASVSRVAKYIGYYGMPVITPGGFTFAFSEEKTKCSDEYYMTINSGPTDFRSFGEFFYLIMNRYKWEKISLMYEKDQQTEVAGENTCKFIMESIIEEVTSVKKLDFQDGDMVLLKKDYRAYLEDIVGVNYGIILTCTSSEKLREFAIIAQEMGMMESGEYTIFNFETYNNSTDPSRPWYDANDTEDRNDLAKKAFRSIFTFTPYDEANFASVEKQQQRGSIYLDGLYDGMKLYATAIDKALNESNGTTPKGYDIVRNMMGTEFKGKNGNILMNCNGQRVAKYVMLQLNSSDKYDVVAEYSTQVKTINQWKVQWLNGDPLDTPKCGYDQSLCPPLDTEKILLISLILVMCLGILIVGLILYRHFKLKRAIYSMAWKVNYDDIVLLPIKPRSSFQSTSSLRRGSQLVIKNELF